MVHSKAARDAQRVYCDAVRNILVCIPGLLVRATPHSLLANFADGYDGVYRHYNAFIVVSIL